MSEALQNITCPACGKKNTWKHDNAFRPFCSERCRLIDLGEWADESYRVESEDQTDADETSDVC